ncbi:MAG: helix-turn-helix domain-containing protein [Parcubacteria group bacterium]
MINDTYIGARIREAREVLGLSQEKLAKELGYESGTALSLIESGERKVKASDLIRLGEILHRDVKFFLGSEEKQPNLRFALRADKDLTDKDKEALLRFIDLAKGKKQHGK